MSRALLALAATVALAACSGSHEVDAGDLGVDANDAGPDLGSPDFGMPIDCGVPPMPDASAACPVHFPDAPCDGGSPGFVFDGVNCLHASGCSDFPDVASCTDTCAASGRCNPGVNVYFWPPDLVGGRCALAACGGQPPELCVTRGSASEATIRASLAGVDCHDPAAMSFSSCDPSLDSCAWSVPLGDASPYSEITPALWTDFCAVSLLPDVVSTGCIMPIIF